MEIKSLNNIINIKLVEMDKALNHLKNIFSKIRAGKATTYMLNSIYVKYHGTLVPLHQISNISVINSTTLSIQPWEHIMLSVIEKAIINSNIGFTPMKNGEILLIKLPPLTEESRKQLVKKAKIETENTKISVRNIRKESNNFLKKIKKTDKDIIKNLEYKIQDITNKYINKIDKLFIEKEKEIMNI